MGNLGKVGLIVAGLIVLSSPVSAQCCGDCNGDGTVTIAEIIGAVNRGLGLLPCESGPTLGTPTQTPQQPRSTPTPDNNQKIGECSKCDFQDFLEPLGSPNDRCSKADDSDGNPLGCFFCQLESECTGEAFRCASGDFDIVCNDGVF